MTQWGLFLLVLQSTRSFFSFSLIPLELSSRFLLFVKSIENRKNLISALHRVSFSSTIIPSLPRTGTTPRFYFVISIKPKKEKWKKKKTKRPPPSPHCHSLFVWLHVRRKAGKITTHSSSPQYQFTHSFWPPISALPLPPPYGWMCAIHTQKEKKEEEITQEKERTKEKLCPTFNRI